VNIRLEKICARIPDAAVIPERTETYCMLIARSTWSYSLLFSPGGFRTVTTIGIKGEVPQ